MKKEYLYDLLVFIGRFQPFHKGHQHVIKSALKRGRYVFILCGSAHQPRSIRNPWSVEEREEMLRSCFSPEENTRIFIAPLMDVLYNDELWIYNVQQAIESVAESYYDTVAESLTIGLIGHSKDSTSYYLKLFPQWSSVEIDNYQSISSTPIRQAYFIDRNSLPIETLPPEVLAYLARFTKSRDYIYLCEEWAFIQKYQQGWELAPYPPTFVTVDAVVIQSGHILLVERKARPGKGQLALPGGFVRQQETLMEACLRELREETKLKVPEPVLKGSIIDRQVFDEPNRSSRGRTITHAFYIELKPDTSLPKVKGGDDAKTAFWLPLSQLDSSSLYEDHYFIIQKFLGLI